MPMVRIGDALISLGLITEPQLDEALAQQAHDRSVPLGELLVRMGAVSRDDLQVALARKMGYPLVDLASFAVEADALRKLPFAVAARLGLMPLLVRDGRLVVALDDPARRRAALEEVEFVTQMKIGAGAGAVQRDRAGAARGVREVRPGHRRPASPSERRRRTIESDQRRHRQAGQDAGEGRQRQGERRGRPADRAVRQLAGEADQQHDRRGLARTACRTSTSRAIRGASGSRSASARTACCAPTWSCRTTTAMR